MRLPLLILLLLPGLLPAQTWVATSPSQPSISHAEYLDRARAFWLGQAIANWTGLRTEGRVLQPPFLTDHSWGGNVGLGRIEFVLYQDPWLADDDTDIEAIYLHLLDQSQLPYLPPQQIAEGWKRHINRFIWVSNDHARKLMNRGILPPSTGLGAANPHFLMIDAQLTTEFFGALAPGMPGEALLLAEPAIRTSASGYAAHAAQFYVLLHSQALVAPKGEVTPERIVGMVRAARGGLPDSSRAADIIDTVLADYLANPDKNDWERTRDLLYRRYQRDAASNGFVHRGWFESPINLGTGVMALLYGAHDPRPFARTVQIGTLSGWDSDNGTATMGGLMGLLLGMERLTAEFPGVAFSDRFQLARTRDNVPDALPGDPNADDTFTLMAERMWAIAGRVVVAYGGRAEADRLILPAEWPIEPLLAYNPGWREHLRCQNLAAHARGASPVASSTPGGNNAHRIADGFEMDFSGREYYGSGTIPTFASPRVGPGQEVALTVTYDRPVPVHTVRFFGGDHGSDGGWFQSFTAVEVLVDDAWVEPDAALPQGNVPAFPFGILDVVLPATVQASAIRIRGVAGGSGRYVTCAELTALAP